MTYPYCILRTELSDVSKASLTLLTKNRHFKTQLGKQVTVDG